MVAVWRLIAGTTIAAGPDIVKEKVCLGRR